MKVKQNIDFIYSEDEKIKIYVDHNFVSEISLVEYNLLYILTKLQKKELFVQFVKDSFDYSDESGELLYSILVDRFSYILDMENYDEKKNIVLPYFGRSTGVLYPERIRSIVPKVIVISLTRNCFMKCRYCYADANYAFEQNESDLSLEQIEDILKQCRTLNINTVELTGGDSFIRKDIFSIFELFDCYGIKTSVSTKKLLTQKDIMRLKKFRCLEYVQISIDTDNDVTEKELLGEEKYCSNRFKMIRELLDNDINVKVNAVVTKLNIKEIPGLIKTLNDIGVHELSLSPYVASLGRNDDSFFPAVDQLHELFKYIEQIKNSINLKITFPKYMDPKEKMFADMTNGCSAGLDGFVIGPNGDVAVCERLVYDKRFCLGNIKDNTILEIWNSDIFKQFTSPNLELYKDTECYKCNDIEYCIFQRGMCLVQSIILNGKIFLPDNACKYNLGQKRVI